MHELLAALVRAGILSVAEAQRIERISNPVLARALTEQELAALVQTSLNGQQARLIDLVRSADMHPSAAQMNAFWRNEDRIMAQAMIPTIEQAAQDIAMAGVMTAGDASMWQAINEGVITWVQDYYISLDASAVGSIPNLNETARTIVGNAFSAWQRGELEAPTSAEGLPQLIAAMADAFGPERGERIAVTETTRIYVESTRAAANANPRMHSYIFHTAADEIVCPQCGPLHGMVIEKEAGGFTHPALGDIGFPPIHVNCRCGVSPATEAVAALGPLPGDTWQYSGPEAQRAR